MLAALTLPFLAAFPAQDQDSQDKAHQQRVEKLIRDLGHEEFEARESAQKELEKIGKPAAPALRKAAAESEDAEIASRARELLRKLEPPPAVERKDRSGAEEFERSGPGFHFRVVRRQNFGGRGGDLPQGFDMERFQRRLNKFVERVQGGQFDPDELRKWMDDLMRDMEGAPDPKRREEGPPTSIDLGAEVRERGEGEPGVEVTKVSPKSRASRAGLKEGDVVVSINGRKTDSVASFGKAFAEALRGEIDSDLEFEAIREGERKTIKTPLIQVEGL
jgi:hypothetical protein